VLLERAQLTQDLLGATYVAHRKLINVHSPDRARGGLAHAVPSGRRAGGAAD
jgi:hypothetical protein